MIIKDKSLEISELKLKIAAGWKSVDLNEGSKRAAAVSYQPPIGVIRTF